MSFTPIRNRVDSSFNVIVQSLLADDTLPFADALTAEHIQQAFDDEQVARHGEPAVASGTAPDRSERTNKTERTKSDDDSNAHSDATVYTRALTLWAMLSQALSTGVHRSCVAAVQRIAVYAALRGVEVSSTNTGAYCRARARISEPVVRGLAEGVAARSEASVPDEWKWFGFAPCLLDGSTHSMPDTEQNQAEYPQSRSQKPGLGFPVMRSVALTSLQTGMVLAVALGPCVGKETGETALARTLFDHLKPGSLVVADRYYAGWFMLALMQLLGIEFVTRLNQNRTADFNTGTRLGKGDHLAVWDKPPKPKWLDQATYDLFPAQLTVREVEVRVDTPGFRTKSLVAVTSLHEHTTYTSHAIAALYRLRWMIELHFRDIKTTMQLDILRSKTPAAVRRELWTGILAYNLVRQSILQSAVASNRPPHRLSFAASLQLLANTWLIAALFCDDQPSSPPVSGRERMIALRLLNGHSHCVGHRPDRVEPRAVKRRAAPIAILTELRSCARERLISGPKV